MYMNITMNAMELNNLMQNCRFLLSSLGMADQIPQFEREVMEIRDICSDEKVHMFGEAEVRINKKDSEDAYLRTYDMYFDMDPQAFCEAADAVTVQCVKELGPIFGFWFANRYANA